MSSMRLGDVRESRSETSMPLLAVLAERALVPSRRALLWTELVLGLAELRGALLAVELVEQRLGIERLQVARPAGHEQEDDRAGLGRASEPAWEPAEWSGPARAALVEQRRQGQPAEAAKASRTNSRRVRVGR